ncbi:hypothetical protein Tco_0972397 [Tanacetum coccineum]
MSLSLAENVIVAGADNRTRTEIRFKRAFLSLFGQDVEIFTSMMFLYVNQLEKQLDKDDFQEDESMAAFWVLNKICQQFIYSQFSLDYDNQMTNKSFSEYTRIEAKDFKDTLLKHMSSVKKSIAERARHRRLYNRRVNKRQLLMQKSKGDMGTTLDVDSVVTESNGIESEKHDTSSRFGNDTHAKYTDIKPVNDKEPMAEEAKKMTQDKNTNLKPREIPSARTHHTPNACTPKLPSNNQMSRNWPASKSSDVPIKVVQKADNSRNPSSFLDSKHFVCLTCQKCVFNANHDACVTKLLKDVNSHVKIQSPKTRHSNKPVKQKSNTQTPVRQILTGHRFSPNKSSAVYEKTSPRSCLRWKTTGRIFNTVGLRWVPTGKMFTDSTTKVDNEPSNDSNADITNTYECEQTLNVSVCTLNLSAGTSFNPKKERLRVWLLKRLIS